MHYFLYISQNNKFHTLHFQRHSTSRQKIHALSVIWKYFYEFLMLCLSFKTVSCFDLLPIDCAINIRICTEGSEIRSIKKKVQTKWLKSRVVIIRNALSHFYRSVYCNCKQTCFQEYVPSVL